MTTFSHTTKETITAFQVTSLGHIFKSLRDLVDTVFANHLGRRMNLLITAVLTVDFSRH